MEFDGYELKDVTMKMAHYGRRHILKVRFGLEMNIIKHHYQ